jgi:transposase, IS605 OrfB family, central region
MYQETVFRTIKVKLIGNIDPLLKTAILYTQACQLALDYGFMNKTHNKKKLNAGTYRCIRKQLPLLPSSLVQCARDQAAELLKRERCKTLPTKKRLQVRYDKRTFKFYAERQNVSLSTAAGRLNFRVNVYDYCRKYLNGTYTNAQLTIRNGKALLNIQYRIPDVPSVSNLGNARVLGIDRGIMNIVTCSDNSFVNSRHLRAVKGRYQYLKAKLQSIGTASAKRKLKKLFGAERRFTLDVNHVITRTLVQKPYEVYAVEALKVGSWQRRGRRLNRMLGGWSYGELLSLLTYKAENLGKRVARVNPSYTSQRCSRCGYTKRDNRKGLRFRCRQCGFELNADLNAARNIGQLGRSELVRLPVNQPIVAHNGPAATNHSLSGFGS